MFPNYHVDYHQFICAACTNEVYGDWFDVDSHLDVAEIQTEEEICNSGSFNENSSLSLKYLSLFKRKRIIEIAENNYSIPIDAFYGLEAVNKKIISAKDLKREYLQFVNMYLKFE
ncbi:hypothetical protein QTP88_020353 [Uroleucon formosanum]